jgi:TPR repeat protein
MMAHTIPFLCFFTIFLVGHNSLSMEIPQKLKLRSDTDADQFQHLKKEIIHTEESQKSKSARNFLCATIPNLKENMRDDDDIDPIKQTISNPKLIEQYAQRNSLPHMILHTKRLLEKKQVDYSLVQQWVLKCQKRLCQLMEVSYEESCKAWQLFEKLGLKSACKQHAGDQNYHMQYAYGTLCATLATTGQKLNLLMVDDARKHAAESNDYLKTLLLNLPKNKQNEQMPKDVSSIKKTANAFIQELNNFADTQSTIPYLFSAQRLQNIITNEEILNIQKDGYKYLSQGKNTEGIKLLKKYIAACHEQEKVVSFKDYFTLGSLVCSFYPNCVESDDKIAYSYLKKAADFYVRNSEEKKQRAYASLMVGHLCLELKKEKEEIAEEKARHYYKRAADLGNIPSLYYSGIMHYKNKQYDQAEKFFENYIKIESDCAECTYAKWYLSVMQLCGLSKKDKKIAEVSSDYEKKCIDAMIQLSQDCPLPYSKPCYGVLISDEIGFKLQAMVDAIFYKSEVKGDLTPDEINKCYIMGFLLTHSVSKNFFGVGQKCLSIACNNKHFLANYVTQKMPEIPDSIRCACLWNIINSNVQTEEQKKTQHFAQEELHKAAKEGKLFALWCLAAHAMKEQKFDSWIKDFDKVACQVSLSIDNDDQYIWRDIIEKNEQLFEAVKKYAEQGSFVANILLGGADIALAKTFPSDRAIQMILRSLECLNIAYVKQTGEQLKKTLAESYELLADHYAALGMLLQAYSAYDASAKLGNEKAEIQKSFVCDSLSMRMTETCVKRKYKKEASEILKKYIERNDQDVLYYVGARYLAENNLVAALQYFKRAFKAGNKKAERYIEEVKMLKTKQPIAYLNVAYDCWIHTENRVRQRALWYFNRAYDFGLSETLVAKDELLKMKFDLLSEQDLFQKLGTFQKPLLQHLGSQIITIDKLLKTRIELKKENIKTTEKLAEKELTESRFLGFLDTENPEVANGNAHFV